MKCEKCKSTAPESFKFCPNRGEKITISEFENAINEPVIEKKAENQANSTLQPKVEPLPIEPHKEPENQTYYEGLKENRPETGTKAEPGVWLGVGIGGVLILLIVVGVLSGWFSPKPAATQAPVAMTVEVSPKDGMTMVYVPSGEFLMGSLEGTGENNEHPQHTVYLSGYWIDKTEVTNEMYAKCVADGACEYPPNNSSYTQSSYYGNPKYDKYPVIYVSWYQANNYCTWAERQLPTEAQWEKAARGTDGRIYPWGNVSPDVSLANYESHVGDTTEVGSYPDGASPYGALDMTGNVWEWVKDWYGTYPSGSVSNPTGPATVDYNILRGGSWQDLESNVRSTFRVRSIPKNASDLNGFRCSLSDSVSP
ncbi:MAG: SUMF1/EgtB/PvdO family nonheme iron enzyme [Smithella sp.]|jgi:serine/threonine-protein kinase